MRQAQFQIQIYMHVCVCVMLGSGGTISGTSSQYVMGNGSLLTATYPTLTAESNFVTTFNSGSVASSSIRITRKMTNATNTIIFIWY